MKHWVQPAAVFFTVLAVVSASASALTLQEVMNNLEKQEKAMNSVRFKFTQQIKFNEVGPQADIKGEATFAKPGKMKIAKTQPEEQLTVSNGKKLWVYSPNNKQVWVGSSKNWVTGSVLPQGVVPFDRYVTDLKKNFNLSLRFPGDATRPEVALQADPKDQTLGYKLELVFSTDSWLPLLTIYRSDTGEVITRLSQFQVNPELAKDAFTFTPPAKTEVIPLD